MRCLTPLVALALLSGLGCSEETAPSIGGQWGGPEATLLLSTAGGTVEFLCGSGTIDPGWGIAPGGPWNATGQYFTGGGPIPAEGRPPHPAAYSGMIRGDVLTFSVSVPDLSTTLGPYTVTRGAPGAFEICL
jgi:hypothetical protein